ncbi:dna repair protein [Diplodia corticola]|uniref:Dna repair protein n=1 Tax=Diplodia corticola TaxID=236234 RepID=A0A1J9S5M1_9PEZI|nr:dna repair protein [Diplodia corticola]OJD35815.1 dna repair protein [Diplodia corticola]
MNFAKGILESRRQTYKHLKKLLKTIPLETPTAIELSPGNEIQVTLFDANHCVGAVMFLIQGHGQAILYTGDIRAETWWINSLTRSPVLLPYASGHRRLDKIYLDTTYASRSRFNREFPTKDEGLRELLTKVSNYPEDTVFHIEAWTFGYEDVWLALSSYLDSSVHLDRYRWRLYNSLVTPPELPSCREAPPLVGFSLGNHHRVGCLTSNPDVRLHSCEHGTFCPATNENSEVVRIIPIVTRLGDGTEVAEVGVGGGKGDLDQVHELETHDRVAIEQLMHLCESRLEDVPDTLSDVLHTLTSAMENGLSRIRLCNSDSDVQDDQEALDDMPLHQLVEMLARLTSDAPTFAVSAAAQSGKTRHVSNTSSPAAAAGNLTHGPQSRTITFPWARHASYLELCELVGAFRPYDIHPCTVNEQSWTPEDGMRALFGHLCSGDVFVHDRKMMDVWEERRKRWVSGNKRQQEETQETQSSGDDDSASPDEQGSNVKRRCISAEAAATTDAEMRRPSTTPSSVLVSFEESLEGTPQAGQAPGLSDTSPAKDSATYPEQWSPTKIDRDEENVCEDVEDVEDAEDALEATSPSIRTWAARAAKGSNGLTWADFGGLVCTGNGHAEEEEL